MQDRENYLWSGWGRADAFVTYLERVLRGLAPGAQEQARIGREQVVRVVVVADGKVCDEVHPTRARKLTTGTGPGADIQLFDPQGPPADYRRRAPLWLGLGVAVCVAGVGLLVAAIHRYAAARAAAGAAADELGAFVDWSSGGLDGLGVGLIAAGLVPLVIGLMGLGAPRRRADGARTSQLPGRETLFDFEHGVHYLCVPKGAGGRVTLGRQVASLSQLRRRLGRDGELRLRLNSRARGKLVLGETTLLFRFCEPAARPVTPPLPRDLIAPWRLLVPTPLARDCYLGSLVVLGAVFLFASVAPKPIESPPSQRFVDAMHTVAMEPIVDEPPEDPVPQALAKPVPRAEPKPEPKPRPTRAEVTPPKPHPVPSAGKFSDAAVAKAREHGIALALGTYNQDAEGSVFDLIQERENRLGALMDEGVSIDEAKAAEDIDLPWDPDNVAPATPIPGPTIGSNSEPVLARKQREERRIPVRTRPTTDEIHGEVDKRAVQMTIRKRASALRRCYERAIKTAPGLEGKISYTIEINPRGGVTHVDIEHDDVGSSVAACTTAKVRGWRFPAIEAADVVEVSFSVVFSRAD